MLKHARTLDLDRKTREESENMVLRIFIREFIVFAEQKTPGMLVIIDAIQSTATFTEAQRRAGIGSKEFRKHREQLSLLKDMFLERQSVRKVETRL